MCDTILSEHYFSVNDCHPQENLHGECVPDIGYGHFEGLTFIILFLQLFVLIFIQIADRKEKMEQK